MTEFYLFTIYCCQAFKSFYLQFILLINVSLDLKHSILNAHILMFSITIKIEKKFNFHIPQFIC